MDINAHKSPAKSSALDINAHKSLAKSPALDINAHKSLALDINAHKSSALDINGSYAEKQLKTLIDDLNKDFQIYTSWHRFEVPKLLLRYLLCKFCLSELGKKILNRICSPKKDIKIKGICYALDHIYIEWLRSGKQNVLCMSCPHARELQKHCFYLKGKAVIDLRQIKQIFMIIMGLKFI
jgi:hypothetical protein